MFVVMEEAATSSAPFVALEVIGTIGFAVSGVMAAARARMDWLGAVVLARRQGDLAEDERRGLAGLSRLVDGGEERR